MRLSDAQVVPDGSDVRPLLRLKGGSFAHFELGPGRTSKAVTHRSVEGMVGSRFQFRTLGDEPLAAVAVAMPPWQDGEAHEVPGIWKPSPAPLRDDTALRALRLRFQ